MLCSSKSASLSVGRQGMHVAEQVQEAAAASESFLQMPDASINMGSLFLALDKPKLAIQVHPSPATRCRISTGTQALLFALLCAA